MGSIQCRFPEGYGTNMLRPGERDRARLFAASGPNFSGDAGDSLERSRGSGPDGARAGKAHQLPHGVGCLAIAGRAPSQEQRARLPSRLALFGFRGFGGLIRHRKRLPAVQADNSPGSLRLGLLLHTMHPVADGRLSREGRCHRVSRISPWLPPVLAPVRMAGESTPARAREKCEDCVKRPAYPHNFHRSPYRYWARVASQGHWPACNMNFTRGLRSVHGTPL